MQQFYNPVQINLGPLGEWLPEEKHTSKPCLLLSSPFHQGKAYVDSIKQKFTAITAEVFTIKPNPDIRQVDKLLEELQNMEFTQIIALGGGSVIDAAKGIAFAKSYGTDAFHTCLKGGKLEDTGAPKVSIIAVPTVSGTGSEVTQWGTIWDEQEKKKYSISHPGLYPELSVVDPAFTQSVPAQLTLTSALDSLSHALESTWNINHNPISDSLAAQAINKTMRFLPMLMDDLTNMELRTEIATAALLAGLAFSNTRTAIAHSISYPLTSHFDMPHGLACSFTLPEILKFNHTQCPQRFQHLMTGLGYQSFDDFYEAVKNLFEILQVKQLATKYIPGKDAVIALKRELLNPQRAGNNIAEVNADEGLTMILNSL